MYSCTFSDLVRRISKMSDREKVAFATRTLRLVESRAFRGMSAESKDRAWHALDLCTQP